MNSSFKGKTVLITGASRGIGKAIGLRLAKEGANIIVASKTTEVHPKLEGTIFSAADEMIQAGGQALALPLDVREEEMAAQVVQKAVETFGGIDILVNNASAISLTPTAFTEMKRYDLMHAVNVRGTFLMSKLCLPHLKKSENPHILNLSPPLHMESKWFSSHVAYSMTKFGMSMCVLGMSEEFKDDRIAVNALWPRTTIATAALKNLLGGDAMIQASRTPEIMADAAYFILQRESSECTGNFFIDDEVLTMEGVYDFRKYAVDPNVKPMPDFFV
jgi:citronellol/citronellal dehydrogenase